MKKKSFTLVLQVLSFLLTFEFYNDLQTNIFAERFIFQCF